MQRAGFRHLLAGRGRKRAAVVAGVATLIGLGSMMTMAVSASGVGTTNGDPVLFRGVTCDAFISSLNLHVSVSQDVTAQAIVPNQVAQGATYQITIPGSSADLPAAASGLNVSKYANLAQKYEFDSSSGSVTITDIETSPLGATATWNPNDGTGPQTKTGALSHGTNTATLSTPGPLAISGSHNGTLTTPDVVLTVTAPNADATVTSYLTEIDTTATVSIGDAATTCAVPHGNP